jgi:hypothetical protein
LSIALYAPIKIPIKKLNINHEIIFLTNLNHSKLISTLNTYDCENIKISLPIENDLFLIIKSIIEKYNIKFDSLQTLKDIVNYSQYDIRRLIIILQDLYYTY